MKKLFLAVAVIIALCSTNANAVSISSSSIVSGGSATTSWNVNGQEFKLTGSNHKTIDTEAGEYTFYADGTYHQGDVSIKQYIKPLSIEYTNIWKETVSGELDCPGRYVSSVRDRFVLTGWYKTSEIEFSCDVYFAYTPAEYKTPLLSGNYEGAKEIIPCEKSTLIIAYETSGDYIHVNYKKFDGYIKTDDLEFVDLIESAKKLTIKKDTIAFYLPNELSEEYKQIKKDTVLNSFSEDGEWYECESDGVRFYVPKADAIVKE